MNNYQCWRAVWVKWWERDWESRRLKPENGVDTSRDEEECKCFPFPGKHESAARCGNDRTDLVIYCSVYSHTLTDGHEQHKWISLKVSALRERVRRRRRSTPAPPQHKEKVVVAQHLTRMPPRWLSRVLRYCSNQKSTNHWTSIWLQCF